MNTPSEGECKCDYRICTNSTREGTDELLVREYGLGVDNLEM